MMFWLGIIIGLVIGTMCGVGIVTLLIANDEKESANLVKQISVINFAERLKAKVNKPEQPWEEPCFFVSDIDEVLREMVGDSCE